MGRTRSNEPTVFIEDERRRVSTHRIRTKNLFKKAKELETLCDIQVCVFMSGPKLSGNTRTAPVRIFPPEPEKARLVIQNFKNATLNKNHRSLPLAEAVKHGKKKQPKTAANHADNTDTWYDRVRKLPLPQVEELLVSVVEKLKHVNVIQEDRRANLRNFMNPSTYDPRVMDPGTNFYYHTPPCPLDHHLDSKSMTAMMMMSEDDFNTQLMTNSHYDHSNSSDPYSNSMTMLMNQADYSSNGYFPYNVPQYGNDVSNFTDLALGFVNDNSRILNNPSTPMWCFGGFMG